MKYLGCAYYPEYWGVNRVETDARLMKEAGINLARIAEFAWSRLEPSEGVFTLDWLHQTVDILGRYGVNVMMCTPTAAPPAWLTSAYPDTVIVRPNGHRLTHGNRKHFCSTSDTYRRHCARITEMLTKEMSTHENVIAWQIDNELGPEVGWCYCENCQSRFQAWLLKKYGSLDSLNHAWGTGFWSMDYTDLRQVRLGSDSNQEYSSRNLDSRRFFSEMMINYGLFQADIIRKNHPNAIVTTNGMGPIYPHFDYYELFSHLDVACDDLYYDIGTMDTDVAAMNFFRSIKPGKNFWITETGSGALDHNKPPLKKQFRAWAWSAWAHGSEAHMIFRWRTCLSGQEQELQGILEHSGTPRHRYQAVKDCFNEFVQLRDMVDKLPLPVANVAIVHDYEVAWAYESTRIGPSVNYYGQLYRLHKEFYGRNILTDIIDPCHDLNKYQLIVLPSMMIIKEEFADKLTKAVENGATVLAVGQLGMRDTNDNYLLYPGPDHLHDLFGVNLYGGMYLDSQVGNDESIWTPEHKHGNVSISVNGNLSGEDVGGCAGKWIGDLENIDSKVLLSFKDDAYQNQPAFVEKACGKGTAYYLCAVSLDDKLYSKVIDFTLKKAGIEVKYSTPLFVEVVDRGSYTCLINHTENDVKVKLERSGNTIIGVWKDGWVHLEPYGVCLIG